MQLTTTFALLRENRACAGRYKVLRKALPDYDDDQPINLLTILETNGLDDALWALCACEATRDHALRFAASVLSIADPDLDSWNTSRIVESMIQFMAADFAEQVLPIWQKYKIEDKRPEMAIKTARDFARGLITKDELAAARSAAGAAARGAAWGAEGAEAGAEEGAEAREKQKQILISYLQ
jgi:hypothetical protein